ncbi:hypothetical protein [Agrobacterium tumefaciens]|uniref:hypothetical protein n=1 Tax=Agrobacterium tumefaciens TaxID=358 RepID=UPI00157449EC|nr:hypothetical protein [Agrobacterium tumefaciens]NTB05900.1 hypothetical protein [Agrobacterium tumefaciens]
MQTTIKDRVKASIRASQNQVFLRKDFEHLGTYRQVSRALSDLQGERTLVRAGYGVYMRPIEADTKQVVNSVRARLGSRRVKRHIVVNGTTVLVGERSQNVRNTHDELDDKKLRMARLIVRQFSIATIRERCLANLRRWNENGVWVSAHDEWRTILERGSDEEVIAAMTGTDQRANRLRQTPPYSGLIERSALEVMH